MDGQLIGLLPPKEPGSHDGLVHPSGLLVIDHANRRKSLRLTHRRSGDAS